MANIRHFALLALGVVACGAGSDPGPAMTENLGETSQGLDELRSSVEAHGNAVHSARTLTEIQELENRHAHQAHDLLDTIGHEIDDMALCEDDHGGHPEMYSMDSMHAACDDEISEHLEAMLEAEDLQAARTEETHHQQEMAERMDELENTVDTMMDTDETYLCAEDDHMDDMHHMH